MEITRDPERAAELVHLVEGCIQALKRRPDDQRALAVLGDCYHLLGAYESAAVMYHAALENRSQGFGLRRRLTRTLVERNRRGFPRRDRTAGWEAGSVLGSLDDVCVPSWSSRPVVLRADPLEAPLSGICNLHGWAAAESRIDRLELWVDGALQGEAAHGGDRLDVFRAHPELADSSRSGFRAKLKTFALAPGAHRLEILAHTGGRVEVVASRAFTVDNSSPCAANMARIVENFAARRVVLDSRPFKLGISLSSKCNLSCAMCRPPGGRGFEGQHMPMETLERVLPLVAGAFVLIPQGYGEPMMHPRFDEIVATLRGLNPDAVIIFTTNGTLMRPERCESLIDSRVSVIEISLDSLVAGTYERIRRGSRLSNVVGNIERMVEAKARRGVAHPHLRLKFVVMKETVEELPSFVEFAAAHGIEHIFLNDVEPFYTDAATFMIDHRVHLATYRLTRELADERGVFLDGTAINRFEEAAAAERGPGALGPALSAAPATTFGRGALCPDPYTTMLVETSGDVTVCCFNGGGVLGNVNETSIEELWNGPRYLALRRGFLDGHHAPECARCIERGIVPRLPEELRA
jgi:MoaA/NifB/PqqE/SkfB family radical SAM enzyme